MSTRSHGGLLAWLDRRRAAQLLGAPLPAAARDVRFVCWQGSSDLAYTETLLRFDASRDTYLTLVRERGLARYEDTGTSVHLPIAWRHPGQLQPPGWWQPSDATPMDAAAAPVGLHGSLAMKWEGGHVYAYIVDTGERAAQAVR